MKRHRLTSIKIAVKFLFPFILMKEKGDEIGKLRGLINLGIALHSFADTWSHQRFSGRHCQADNDIERIEILKGNKWEDLGFLKTIKYNARPDIGHAEANNFPDQSHLT